ALELDEWARDLAPSADLIRWYGHAPERWAAFRERYLAELATPAQRERLRALLVAAAGRRITLDRKSTRLNSSHVKISYAVFCLSRDHQDLQSFPTRRSSDLSARTRRVGARSRAERGPDPLVRPRTGALGRVPGAVSRRARHARAARTPACAAGCGRRKTHHARSEEHTSELQSRENLVCRLLLVARPPGSTVFPYTTLFRSKRSNSTSGRAISRRART